MVSIEEDFNRAYENIQQREPVAYYAISCLDDFLQGIYEDDLVIITAQTGAGKTELAYDIAYSNAKNKKVLLYALEADIDEPIKRRQYKIFADLYYADTDKDKPYQDFSYRNFMNNKLVLDKYVDKARKLYCAESKPTIVYYEPDFNIDSFKQKLLSTNKDYDLIILDHLDYFDVLDNVSENAQMSNIMKELRLVNTMLKKPVIAISHLRKNTRKTLMPTIDDLMGSSNKAKQAKIVITLAPDKEGFVENGLHPTYISIQKSRYGSTGNLLIKQVYDSKTNMYQQGYSLYNYNAYEDKVEALDLEKYPQWAKNQNWSKKGEGNENI